MSYVPSKSVEKWVDEIFEIIGHSMAVPDSPLSLEKQYDIRRVNSVYLGQIRLGPVERARAEATRRNLLDGYIVPWLR